MKISYVSGICVRNDAISASIRNEMRMLEAAGHDVRFFGYACDFEEMPFSKVDNVWEITVDPHFRESDLVVFHFGIFYPLFDALMLVPSRAKRVVVFHNITPAAMVAEESRALIEKSLRQMHNISFSDKVFCVSQVNQDVLDGHGIETPAQVLPLAVDPVGAPVSKPSVTDDVQRILFIGRFVKSKGLPDALAAIEAALQANTGLRLRFDLVGNTLFSDPRVIEQIEATADRWRRQYADRARLQVHGNADEARKRALLSDADLFLLPSYHEGFCVPVVEAISAGCRVLTYDNSNLAYIGRGQSRTVATGDVAALGRALSEMLADSASTSWKQARYQAYARDAAEYSDEFREESVSCRFLSAIEGVMAMPATRSHTRTA